jgi:hypothetical protein
VASVETKDGDGVTKWVDTYAQCMFWSSLHLFLSGERELAE